MNLPTTCCRHRRYSSEQNTGKAPSAAHDCLATPPPPPRLASPSPSRRAAGTPPGWGCRTGSLWGSLCTTVWARPRWTRCSWSGHPGPLEPACCCVSPWCLASLGGGTGGGGGGVWVSEWVSGSTGVRLQDKQQPPRYHGTSAIIFSFIYYDLTKVLKL